MDDARDRHSWPMTSENPERLASAGDAKAQLELAFALLARTDSVDAFAGGTALVEAAKQQGHAEDLHDGDARGDRRRTVPKPGSRFFDCLQLAAERGSPHARDQLRLLCRIGEVVAPESGLYGLDHEPVPHGVLLTGAEPGRTACRLSRGVD